MRENPNNDTYIQRVAPDSLGANFTQQNNTLKFL